MVKSHEDAFWPDNLSLFYINCIKNQNDYVLYEYFCTTSF